MKVLYISYDGLTDPLGQSQIIPYLVACSSADVSISVLSFEKSKAFKKSKDLIENSLKEAHISWIPKPYTKHPPLISSFIDLRRMIREAGDQIKKNNIDLIHCRSYVPAFAAFYLKKKHGVKVVFDMRGFWADERLEGGIWKETNPIHQFLYRSLKRKEKKWWQEADHLISLTEKGKEIICDSGTEIRVENISVIPCCADEKTFTICSPSDRNQIRNQLGLEDSSRLLIYVGSLGTWYLSEEMMRQFAHLHRQRLFTHFLWVTKDSKDEIEEIARKNELPAKSVIVKSASRKEVSEYLCAADLGIFYIKPSYSKSASSPTKLGEMLLSGLPVIANSGVGDLDSFFSENQVGFVHDLQDERHFEIPIKEIEKLLNLNPADIREVGLKTLSLKKAKTSYLEVYNLMC